MQVQLANKSNGNDGIEPNTLDLFKKNTESKFFWDSFKFTD